MAGRGVRLTTGVILMSMTLLDAAPDAAADDGSSEVCTLSNSYEGRSVASCLIVRLLGGVSAS